MCKESRKWLMELRGEKRQEDVADTAGISRSSYSNIENGNRDPSVETAKKIAQVLNFDWTIFFDQERFVSNHMSATESNSA